MDTSTLKYSRQSAVYGGAQSIEKLRQARVLVFGLGPAGVETVKNVLLAGVACIDVVDQSVVENSDADGVFCFNETLLGKDRSSAYIPYLRELAPSSELNCLESGDVTDSQLSTYQVVVVTNEIVGSDKTIDLSRRCHKLGVYFICGSAAGLHLSIFQDVGNYTHNVGRPKIQKVIGRVEDVDDTGASVILTDSIFSVSDGDKIFLHRAGTTADDGPFLFERLTKEAGTLSCARIKILGCTLSGEQLQGAHVYNETTFESCTQTDMEENIASPRFKSPTLRLRHKLMDSKPWIATRALAEFYRTQNRRPKLHDDEDADKFVSIAYELWVNQTAKAWTDTEQKYFKRMSLIVDVVVSPVITLLGAILSQEVNKVILQLYTPIDQWFMIDFMDILPQHWETQTFSTVGPGAFLGTGVSEKLSRSRLFMVGAGALGCEFIKCFNTMGLCSQNGGTLHVSDPDEISESNLHRQFLFREEDVGKSKSQVAVDRTRSYAGKINAINYNTQVSEASSKTFDDDFWQSLDLIVVAVDSVKARVFLNEQSHYYDKVMMESGTFAMQCNNTVIVPGKTEPYIAPEDNNAEANCTGKSYPFRPNHTAQWAVELFNKLFHDQVKNFQLGREGAVHLSNEEILIVYQKLSVDTEFRRQWASQVIEQYFNTKIKNIIKDHPRDEQNEDGVAFWSGVRTYPDLSVLEKESDMVENVIISILKMCESVFPGPTLECLPQSFEKDDLNHLQFVLAVNNLYSKIYKIPLQSSEQIHLIAGNVLSAVLSTTAVSVSLTCFEIYKVLQGMNNVDHYNFNGADNSLGYGRCKPKQRHSPSMALGHINMEVTPQTCWNVVKQNIEDNGVVVEHMQLIIANSDLPITHEDCEIGQTLIALRKKQSDVTSIKLRCEYIDNNDEYYDLLVRLFLKE